MLSCALGIAALFEIAAAVNPMPAAALPSSGLISEVTGSKLFDNGTGFTWGTSGSSFVITRSQDGGKTWSKLDLDGVSIDLGVVSSPVYVHFDDPDHGWVVWSENDTVLHIANTSDSGTSWQDALSLQTDAVLDRQIFPGPGRACLVAEMAEGMLRTTMVTIATDDNGVTWTPSPFGGDGVRDCTFRSATDGFLSIYNPNPAGIFFYRTTDGGKSWQGVDLLLPHKVSTEDVYDKTPGKTVFSGPQLLTGQLTVTLFQRESTVNVVYRTTDGGKTWTHSK
jgi:photosystem II stability/assembly factor-like uncharacterized protein